MSDDGTTKDDVKIPDGEVGDKIKKFFVDDGKDTSKQYPLRHWTGWENNEIFFSIRVFALS